MENKVLYCVLEDCNNEFCHHCFPVKNCKLHKICIEKGQLEDMNEFLKNKNKMECNKVEPLS